MVGLTGEEVPLGHWNKLENLADLLLFAFWGGKFEIKDWKLGTSRCYENPLFSIVIHFKLSDVDKPACLRFSVFVKLNQNNYKYWDGNAVYGSCLD